MLVEFIVENFRSIKEEVVLSMLASSDKSLPDNLLHASCLGEDKLLSSSVIYGANASGKTNVIYALNILYGMVIRSHGNQHGDPLPYDPFRLDPSYALKPTEFAITFINNNIKYNLYLKYNKERIIEESLYHYPKKRAALIYRRRFGEPYKFIKDVKRQREIEENTPDNVLYMSRATQMEYKPVKNAFEWFFDKVFSVGPTGRLSFQSITFDMIRENEEIKKEILPFFKWADPGIEDIQFKDGKIPLDNIPFNDFQDFKVEDNGFKYLKVQTFHKNVAFNFDDESDGTKQFIHLIGVWLGSLETGQLLIIDELDIHLHEMICIKLMQMFQDPKFNKNGSQVIFTTHNTNLLNQDLFRRDQIWFTEKNPTTHATDLYSLAIYRPRKDKNIQRGYLSGRYGAIPFIDDTKVL